MPQPSGLFGIQAVLTGLNIVQHSLCTDRHFSETHGEHRTISTHLLKECTSCIASMQPGRGQLLDPTGSVRSRDWDMDSQDTVF